MIHKLTTDCTEYCLYDWYFVPQLNPDGYEYAMNVDYTWVKNRDPQGGEDCVGVYLDLNFEPFYPALLGASTYPCDWNYYGPTQTAEVSALTAARIIPQNNMLAISFLKTGNMLLHPKSSGGNPPSKQLEFGEEFTSAINNAGIGAPFDHT